MKISNMEDKNTDKKQLDYNQLKWMATAILADVVKDPDYAKLFKSGDKKTIMRMVIKRLYAKGIYCKLKYVLFKGRTLVRCTKEECEKFLNE